MNNESVDTKTSEIKDNENNEGCPLCGKKLKGHALYGHLHSHGFKNGQHLFECEKCSEKFTKPADFWKHQRIHDKTSRPISCKLCTKTFERESQLQYHKERDHEGRRPHKVNQLTKNYSILSFMNLAHL